MNRPNVLLIYTDQHRWDALGCAANPHIKTPNLDRLAAEGAMMTQAFVNAPTCMPSRQSMLSGQYPSAIGSTCNGIEMPEDVPTVWNVLQPYGYHAANIGKLHFKCHATRDHREPHPTYGLDTLILSDEPGCYDDAYIKWVAEHDPSQVENCRCSTPPQCVGRKVEKQPRKTATPYVFEGPEELTHSAFVADETAEFIRRRAGAAERFFCIAGFYAPHCPLNPPQRFVDMVDVDAMPLPERNEDENRWGLDERGFRKMKAYYYALVMHIDDQVGRILAALDETGAAGDTLVIFTADHGEHLGDHGNTDKGPPGYDSCMHVPLLLRLPGRIEAGRRPDELIEAVDIVPTILDYCGVQTPPTMQGRSFRPLLEGGAYDARASVYMESRVPFGQSVKTVRTREHWYAAFDDGKEILFDLRRDPHQLTDVAGRDDARDALHAMRRELIRRGFDVENQYPLRQGPY